MAKQKIISAGVVTKDGAGRKARGATAPSGGRSKNQEAAVRFLELLGAMKRFIREDLPPFNKAGMSEEKFRTLLSLRALGSGSLSALAGHDGLSTPAQCIMLNRLVKEGFATRRTDASDRRKARYAPTGAGLALLAEEIERRSTALAGMLCQLSAAEGTEFAKAVETLLAVIGKISTKS